MESLAVSESETAPLEPEGEWARRGVALANSTCLALQTGFHVPLRLTLPGCLSALPCRSERLQLDTWGAKRRLLPNL